MIKIAPSILSADFLRFGDEIKAIESAGADYIHIDVMDGHFVDNITFGPGLVESVKRITKVPLDVHLMIRNPEKYVEAFARAGSDVITFHIEATKNPIGLLDRIRTMNKFAGISINPDTPESKLSPKILARCDWVLVMTVYPGFSAQKFIPEALPKIKEIRKILDESNYSKIELAIDGGVKLDNIAGIAGAGATVIASGSGIFKTADYKKTIQEMRRVADIASK
ncbi:MAG TPA: ribulose-phosphate 3-epimerase [bacterium]